MVGADSGVDRRGAPLGTIHQFDCIFDRPVDRSCRDEPRLLSIYRICEGHDFRIIEDPIDGRIPVVAAVDVLRSKAAQCLDLER